MFTVQVGRRAERGLQRIRQGDPRGYERVAAAIRSLGSDPRPVGATKLKNFEPAAWRVRVGQYRIVYEIHDDALLIIIVNVAPRGEVYR